MTPRGQYGAGTSEEWIGRALRERGAGAREGVILATKVFGAMGPGPNERGLSRLHVMQAVEDSLRRLQTDHVDLYYLHWPDAETPLDATARAMDDLVRSGKVRYWGTSNHPAWQVTRAHWLADRLGLHPPVAEQSPYSLLDRAAERELLPCARALGFAFNPYSPLAGGLLTGKYAPGEARRPIPAPPGTRAPPGGPRRPGCSAWWPAWRRSPPGWGGPSPRWPSTGSRRNPGSPPPSSARAPWSSCRTTPGPWSGTWTSGTVAQLTRLADPDVNEAARRAAPPPQPAGGVP